MILYYCRRLDSNALICDCELIWLAQMLKNNNAHTQAIATCDYPGNLKGRSLMSIDPDEFNCSTRQAGMSIPGLRLIRPADKRA